VKAVLFIAYICGKFTECNSGDIIKKTGPAGHVARMGRVRVCTRF
jgi:hypothetical protein